MLYIFVPGPLRILFLLWKQTSETKNKPIIIIYSQLTYASYTFTEIDLYGEAKIIC